MCETRDLVCKVWHTLMFDGEIKVDMRHFCPKDVQKNSAAASKDSLLEVGSTA